MRRVTMLLRTVLLAALFAPLQLHAHAPAAAGAPVTSQPLVSIAALDTSAFIDDQVFTVQGIVTRTDNPIVLQDASGATEVDFSATAPSLRLGDEVQVTGTVRPGLFGARFSKAMVRLLGPSVPYPPLAITPSMAASGRYQRRFIVTEGVLLSASQQQQKVQLLLQRGNQRFVAELPAFVSADDLNRLWHGSVMSVRGVCLVAEHTEGALVPFRVLMRSQEDLRQIAPPPFWTRGHLLAMCALVLLAAYAGHYFYLRLVRWRFHLILQERARVAHDLHDTLAQSFAGIGFQLQALRKASAPYSAVIAPYLDLAIGMVSHSHEDARRAIAMLKPADFNTGSLLDNLRLQGEQLTQGGELTFQVHSKGENRVLSREIEQQLLRVGHEAITNAISHAQATAIEITLEYCARHVELLVSDNGKGMPEGEPRAEDGTPLRGYGIAGMRTRTRAVGGNFRLHTTAGRGVTVYVKLPVKTRNTAARWRHSVMELLFP